MKNDQVLSIDAATIAAIRRLCLQEHGIVAAYLFGSAAKGRMKPGSDIDIALLVAPDEEESFPLLEMMVELERLSGKKTDVVLLNRAGELLKYEVRRTGRLIFERDPVERKRFEISGRKHYEDFLHLHRKYTFKNLYGKRHGQHRPG